MWRMLCASQKEEDFKVVVSDINEDNYQGSAHWEAFYTFSKTGRKVHNVIEAEFQLSDGKIIRHIDHFNLYRWSRQALGIRGVILGWMPFFKNKLQQQTHTLLIKFEQRSA